jgi:hypothetical protein
MANSDRFLPRAPLVLNALQGCSAQGGSSNLAQLDHSKMPVAVQIANYAKRVRLAIQLDKKTASVLVCAPLVSFAQMAPAFPSSAPTEHFALPALQYRQWCGLATLYPLAPCSAAQLANIKTKHAWTHQGVNPAHSAPLGPVWGVVAPLVASARFARSTRTTTTPANPVSRAKTGTSVKGASKKNVSPAFSVLVESGSIATMQDCTALRLGCRLHAGALLAPSAVPLQ